MAHQLEVLNARITATATLTITCDSSANPEASKPTLRSVRDLSVHRRALRFIDIVATYTDAILAEASRGSGEFPAAGNRGPI